MSLTSQGADLVSGMSGTSKRSYTLFNDGLTSGMTGTGTLNLFIAALDYTDMMAMATFPALSSVSTTTLHYYDGAMSMYAPHAATPVTVEGCLSVVDCANAANWTAATNSSGGHWSIDFTSGIASGMTNTIYVRLLVGKDGSAEELKTCERYDL